MKTLVYTTAFGMEHFFLLAEQMLVSLRTRGYQGDVVVLTDREYAFPSLLNAKNLILPGNPQPRLVKAALPSLLDTSGYDKILFVDSDVVFLRHPEPLFKLADSRMAIAKYQKYPLDRHSFNLKLFTSLERKNPRLRDAESINTGAMVFPGALFNNYMAVWGGKWRNTVPQKPLNKFSGDYLEQDQPVMQTLLTHGFLEYEYIPDTLQLMPMFHTEKEPLHPDAVLIHLCGALRNAQKKQQVLEIMAEFNRVDGYDDFKKICDRLQSQRNGINSLRRPGGRGAFAGHVLPR